MLYSTTLLVTLSLVLTSTLTAAANAETKNQLLECKKPHFVNRLETYTDANRVYGVKVKCSDGKETMLGSKDKGWRGGNVYKQGIVSVWLVGKNSRTDGFTVHGVEMYGKDPDKDKVMLGQGIKCTNSSVNRRPEAAVVMGIEALVNDEGIVNMNFRFGCPLDVGNASGGSKGTTDTNSGKDAGKDKSSDTDSAQDSESSSTSEAIPQAVWTAVFPSKSAEAFEKARSRTTFVCNSGAYVNRLHYYSTLNEFAFVLECTDKKVGPILGSPRVPEFFEPSSDWGHMDLPSSGMQEFGLTLDKHDKIINLSPYASVAGVIPLYSDADDHMKVNANGLVKCADGMTAVVVGAESGASENDFTAVKFAYRCESVLKALQYGSASIIMPSKSKGGDFRHSFYCPDNGYATQIRISDDEEYVHSIQLVCDGGAESRRFGGEAGYDSETPLSVGGFGSVFGILSEMVYYGFELNGIRYGNKVKKGERISLAPRTLNCANGKFAIAGMSVHWKETISYIEFYYLCQSAAERGIEQESF